MDEADRQSERRRRLARRGLPLLGAVAAAALVVSAVGIASALRLDENGRARGVSGATATFAYSPAEQILGFSLRRADSNGGPHLPV